MLIKFAIDRYTLKIDLKQNINFSLTKEKVQA